MKRNSIIVPEIQVRLGLHLSSDLRSQMDFEIHPKSLELDLKEISNGVVHVMYQKIDLRSDNFHFEEIITFTKGI